jgi:hypothetical protein
MAPNFCDVFTCLNYSEYEAQVKHLEESKEKFTEYEKQDVKCREDLKHNKQKSKKKNKLFLTGFLFLFLQFESIIYIKNTHSYIHNLEE